MSSFGELVGKVSPGLRDLGSQLKRVLDEPADRARELLRREAGERIAATSEGQKVQREYIRGKLTEYAPALIIAVSAGVLAILLARRA